MNGSKNRERYPVHVGCSGWNYKDWRGTVYPPGVPASQWLVRVVGYGRTTTTTWKFQASKPVELHQGGTTPVKLLIPSGRNQEAVQLALNDPPEGITIKDVAMSRDGVSMTLMADASKVKPGLKGNLIVDAFVERVTDQKKRTVRRSPLGTLPAVPFEVVP